MAARDGFESYRELYAVQPPDEHTLEVLGISRDADFAAAMVDPRTLVVADLPVLTALGHLGDRNLDLYRHLAEQMLGSPVGDMYYYSRLAGADDYGEPVLRVLRPWLYGLATTRGVIAYDCAPSAIEQADADIAALLRRIGGVACQQVEGMPKHYHYAMMLGRPNGQETARRPFDFPALYRQALEEGRLVPSSVLDVVGALSDKDCDHVAAYYAARHRPLTDADATEAGFSQASLRHVLTDPRFTKIIYRTGDGHIANLTIFADVRCCSWIDQKLLVERYPDQLENGRILVGIGAISDPNAPLGLARATVSLGAQLIAYAGGEAVIVIATDDLSNRYIPRLASSVLRHNGFDLPPVEAMSGLAFRAVVLQPDVLAGP